MKLHFRRLLSLVLCAVLLFGLLPPISASAAQSVTPMFRMYNPNTGEHFYTGSSSERENLVAAGWNYEGIGWKAPAQGGDPVYRMFNPNAGDHHYTMSWEEVEMLKTHGWQYEGICWNSAPARGTEPLFRLYNPNAFTGTHHYTASTEERDYLVSLGWIYEGIAWFGMITNEENAISRGRWIQMLVSAYGYPENVDGDLATFADIENCEYRSAIEAAVVYNIIEASPNENFDPYGSTTREFAAVTAVNTLGYSPSIAINCNDAGELANPKAVQQAVASGLMALENGYFYPNRFLTQAEADGIIDALEREFMSLQGEGTPEGFTYLDNVITKPALTWTPSGDQLIVPAGEPAPQVGQIIVFGTEQAICVEDVDQVGGQTVVSYSEPALNEFLDSINIEGEADMNLAQIQPAEGIVVKTSSGAPLTTYGFADDMFDVPSTTVGTDLEITLEPAEPIDLGDGWELNFSVDLNIPTVDYKFDVDFDANPFNDTPAILVKNAYVKAQNEIVTHVTFSNGFDTGDPEFEDSFFDDLAEKEFDLCSVPLVGVDGLCVEVDLDLIVTAEGKFEIDYQVYGTVGAQVLNNKVKNISALQSSMSINLAASVSAGPQVGFEAEVFGEDLFSFAVEAGGKATGTITLRDNGLLCMDANAHVYAEILLLEDCVIDDWLNIGVTYTIWDEDNSPVQIKGHWENFVKVPECTCENGIIKGTVADADNRTHYIQGASIKVMDHDSLELLEQETSDANGQYTVMVDGGGTVLIRISADGYLPFECLQSVGAGYTAYLETFLMVEGTEGSNETGTIGGNVRNAVTAIGIPNATMTIRKGWNMTSGEVVKTVYTDSNGQYSATLPIGNYTISIACDGYVSNHINVAVTTTGNNGCNATLNPDQENVYDLGDLRVVLTWTDEPADLDSHLWGPTPSGDSMYHIYYSDMEYEENGITHAFLDVDDTYYYGPETTTVYDMTPNGTYSFYVFNFTNRSSTGSTVLANSGAKVEVYIGETMIAQYFVPTSGIGDTWHVFNFNARTGTISAVNQFSDGYWSDEVGSPYLLYGTRSDPTVSHLPEAKG